MDWDLPGCMFERDAAGSVAKSFKKIGVGGDWGLILTFLSHRTRPTGEEGLSAIISISAIEPSPGDNRMSQLPGLRFNPLANPRRAIGKTRYEILLDPHRRTNHNSWGCHELGVNCIRYFISFMEIVRNNYMHGRRYTHREVGREHFNCYLLAVAWEVLWWYLNFMQGSWYSCRVANVAIAI